MWHDDYGEFGMNKPSYQLTWVRNCWRNMDSYAYANYIREFNQDGVLQNETWFDASDSIYKDFRYEYDRDGNLSKVLTRYSFGGLDIDDSNYRNCNIVSRSSSSDWNATTQYFVYEFDSDNKLFKTIYYDENGFNTEFRYVYDENRRIKDVLGNNKLIFQKFSDGSTNYKRDSIGETFVKQKIRHDVEGRIIDNRYFSQESQSTEYSSQVFEYDKSGKIVREVKGYPINLKGTETTYKYVGERMESLKMKDLQNNETFRTIRYYYDSRDLLVKTRQWWKENRGTCTFAYVFDHKNNWIEQTKSVNGKPCYKRTRKITYYD